MIRHVVLARFRVGTPESAIAQIHDAPAAQAAHPEQRVPGAGRVALAVG